MTGPSGRRWFTHDDDGDPGLGHTSTTDGPAVKEVEAVSPGGKLSGRDRESALGEDSRSGKDGLDSDHFVCCWEGSERERRKC